MTSAVGSLLVVDDNEANRDSLSRRLRARGYDVGLAVDGEDALTQICQGAYELILLDVEMPGLSGLDVLSRLRETQSSSELPVIMVTARSQGTDIVEALRLGANDYITKPIDFPVALARIETHLTLKRTATKLRESEERYALAMRGANDGLWDWDLVRNEVYWSPRWKAMLGYDEHELTADPDEWFDRVHRDDLPRVKAALDEHLNGHGSHYESEHRVVHRDGSYRWVICRGAAIRAADGRATRLAGSLTDITNAKFTDPLTGLPTRLLFDELLARALKRAERRDKSGFALLFYAVDRFAELVNSLGREAADQLLPAIARRLQNSLRAADAITRGGHDFAVARFGGEEFAILLDGVTTGTDAIRVAGRLRAALEAPLEVDGQTVFASASVGIAVAGREHDRPEQLVADARLALHHARQNGSTRCEVFRRTMREGALLRLRTETALHRAADATEFEVYYQPIVSLASGQIAAFEAVVRWRHPERGLLAPADFLQVAEDTGVILRIGQVMLVKACRQLAIWMQEFGSGAPAHICVNVASQQFHSGELLAQVREALTSSNLAPDRLKLEVTESAFLDNLEHVRSVMHDVRELGAEWSLDDFGTGYSSLSYLHHLPANTVKIDRAFISRIGQDPSGAVLVKAITSLAHTLGMNIVAEGIETADQAAALRHIGCEFAQGYYFAHPVDATAAAGLIQAQPWASATANATA